MSQQSIMGRITQLARANIHSLLDQAEDPQKMLDQMVRDYTSAISDAEGAVAQTIGNLRMMEDDAREAQNAASQWGLKAVAASKKADEMRAGGDAAEADRFDGLARIALRHQIDGEADSTTLATTIADQTDVVDKLKAGLTQMRGKLDDLRRKRDELVGRAKNVQAQNQVRDSIRSVDILDPSSEVARFEEKIRREEARIRGHEELAASSIDAQFESLGQDAADADVEARLAKLKRAS
ncbi:MAG TPA: PspA/IM30 family protein [Micromonosporaceae bacterium]|jgi:phage shock protein A